MSKFNGQPHAVLVPGPGLGHMNGMVLLAKALLSAGFRVTMAFFECAYRKHASKGRLNLSQISVRVELVEDGLSPDASSLSELVRVTPCMHRNLLQLLQSLSSQQQPATCLVSDILMAWTQHVADEVGIPRVEYCTGSATAYSALLALPDLVRQGYVGAHKGEVPRSWKSKKPVLLDCVPGHTCLSLDEVPSDLRYTSSPEDPLLQRFLEAVNLVHRADCLLIHSVLELEPLAFQALQNVAHIEAYPIGPLINQPMEAAPQANPTLSWLDTKAPASVIYVSFGSTVVHTQHEIVELAYGLEASDNPFLWVVRSDSLPQNCLLEDVLPPSFHVRIANRGLIVPWTSQLDVLAHPAVGGFLSHCGWNSTLESLWMGVPLLTCPDRADQPMNSRFIAREWGVGIELQTSGDQDNKPSRHDIVVGIKALLDGASGHLARTKAQEYKCVLRKAPSPGGQSHANLLHFKSKMEELCLSKVK